MFSNIPLNYNEIMITTKNLRSLLPLACLLLTTNPSARADDDLDNFNHLFDENVVDFVQDHEFEAGIETSAGAIAECLIKLGAVKILQQPFYLRTNPLNQRSLLDDPLFLPQRNYCHHWVVGSHLFWNQTERCNFTAKSTAISSYLGVFNEKFLSLLDDALPILKECVPSADINPRDLLPLFANMTPQERRFGFMLHAQRQWQKAHFRIMAPIYYLERNFYLTDEEQIAIETAFTPLFGPGSQDEQFEFAQAHFISDKLGLGDTRITFDVTVKDNDCTFANIGLLTTLPTSVTFASALMGTEFKKECERPTLSLQRLAELSLSEGKEGQIKAAAQVQEFLLSALDAFSANILDTKLGDYRHVGLGLFSEGEFTPFNSTCRPWANNIKLHNRITIEYLFPASEIRYYVQKNDTSGFKKLNLLRSKEAIINEIKENPAYAGKVLDFLENQFIDNLFPFTFKTSVHPGVMFEWTPTLFYEGKYWGTRLGGDFWLQGKEKLKDICVVSTDGRPRNIDIEKATKPLAYEGKVLGTIFYKVNRPERVWTLSLNGDKTVFRSGIGKDFMVSFNVEANF